jgi:hypothetical protein
MLDANAALINRTDNANPDERDDLLFLSRALPRELIATGSPQHKEAPPISTISQRATTEETQDVGWLFGG